MKLKDIPLDLKEKVHASFCDQNKLIGDVSYSIEERNILKEFYNSDEGKTNWSEDAINFKIAFLISVIKNYNGDWTGKEFWDRIISQIGWRPDYKDQLPLIGLSLERYKRPFFVKNGIHKYVESLFYQSYSPSISIKSFIKLAWSLYTDLDVFSYSYFDSEKNKVLCDEIIKSLNVHYKDVDYDSDFTFESVSYSIRAGLRYAFEQDLPSASSLLNRILRYIDSIYHHRESIDEKKEGYLAHICNEIVPKLIASTKITSPTARTHRARETVDDIEDIKVSYVLHNNLLCLYIPKIRLYRDDWQYKKGKVSVYLCFDCQTHLIYSKEIDCVGESFKHLFQEFFIPASGFLPLVSDDIPLRVTLSFDNNAPIYDSKNLLFRKFLVFDGEEECKTSLLKPGDYEIVFPTNFNVSNNIFSKETPEVKNEYQISAFFNDGDRVSFNGKYFFFGSKETGEHIFFDDCSTEEIPNIYFKGNSHDKYSVFKSLHKLIIKTDDLFKPSGIDVQFLDDNENLLHHLPLIDLFDDNGIYTIDLNEAFIAFKNKNHLLTTILVKNQTDNKIQFIKNVVVLPDICISYGKCLYGQSDGSISTVSFLEKCYSVRNANYVRDIEFDTDIAIGEIKAPYFNWKINQGETQWNPLSDSLPVFFDEIQSNDVLYIDSFYENVKVFCGRHQIEMKNKNMFLLGKFKNGPYGLSSFENKEVFYAEIDFNNEKFKVPLFRTTNKPFLSDSNSADFAIYSNGDLTINLQGIFYGNENSIFRLSLESIREKGKSFWIEGDLTNGLLFKDVIEDQYRLSIAYRDPMNCVKLWVQIWNGDIDLRNSKSIFFASNDKLLIIEIMGTKIDNVFLTDICFINDDGFGSKYKGTLHNGLEGTLECEFIIDNVISDKVVAIPISGLYFNDNNNYNEFSFDTKLKTLSKSQPNGKQYRECFFIYSILEKGE